jgi:hypothetical protein
MARPGVDRSANVRAQRNGRLRKGARDFQIEYWRRQKRTNASLDDVFGVSAAIVQPGEQKQEPGRAEQNKSSSFHQ